jgi:hypothetical protein
LPIVDTHPPGNGPCEIPDATEEPNHHEPCPDARDAGEHGGSPGDTNRPDEQQHASHADGQRRGANRMTLAH